MRSRLIFLVGGPDFHPVNEQAATIVGWLGASCACHTAESLAAFEHLVECDLLVLMGQHWTGWEGRYRAPSDMHRRNLEKYIQSGRPILSAHGAIASYDDWPRYGEMVGFRFDWQTGRRSPVGQWPITVRQPGHPIAQGVGDFTLQDELLADIQVMEPSRTQVLAEGQWGDRKVPVVLTTEGGRILGAGKSAYIGLGHDMQSMQSPELRTIWQNAVKWCLTDD